MTLLGTGQEEQRVAARNISINQITGMKSFIMGLVKEAVKFLLLEVQSVTGQGSEQSDLIFSGFKRRVGPDDLWKSLST